MINYISVAILPLMVLIIITYAIIKRVDIFSCFISGAKDGLSTTISILPSLIGLVCAISMLRKSGFIDIITNLTEPILSSLSYPKELVPLCLLRPVSGSGALAIINDLLNNYGPDSFIGRCASIMAGSTETTFYTLAVYLGSVGITNSRYTIKAALLADFTAMLASVYLVKLLF